MGAVKWRREWIVIPFVVFCFWLLVQLRPSPSSLNPIGPSGILFSRYQKPYLKYSSESTSYEVLIVADKDKSSKNEKSGKWETVLRKGTLHYAEGTYSFRWHSDEVTLSTSLSENGRGLELSELVYFVDTLYAPDDRTGVVFAIENGEAIPTYILMDGDGKSSKGFKSEWATVKDGEMWIGGIGKEWTDNHGNVINHNPMWVKVIDREGRIRHINWTEQYLALREATGTSSPGYLIHEAVLWHPILNRWYFLPRRHSWSSYNDEKDEEMGCNFILSADASFSSINVSRIGRLGYYAFSLLIQKTLTPTRGFSSVAFLPGRENHFVALKSMEFKDTIASFLDIETGVVLMEEKFLGNIKYEGLEVV